MLQLEQRSAAAAAAVLKLSVDGDPSNLAALNTAALQLLFPAGADGEVQSCLQLDDMGDNRPGLKSIADVFQTDTTRPIRLNSGASAGLAAAAAAKGEPSSGVEVEDESLSRLTREAESSAALHLCLIQEACHLYHMERRRFSEQLATQRKQLEAGGWLHVRCCRAKDFRVN